MTGHYKDCCVLCTMGEVFRGYVYYTFSSEEEKKIGRFVRADMYNRACVELKSNRKSNKGFSAYYIPKV